MQKYFDRLAIFHSNILVFGVPLYDELCVICEVFSYFSFDPDATVILILVMNKQLGIREYKFVVHVLGDIGKYFHNVFVHILFSV